MNELVAVALTGPAFVTELQRAWDNGDAVLPVDTRLPHATQQALIDQLAAGQLVTQEGERTTRKHGKPVEPGDAIVVATSGTTGEPKGVVHTFESVKASAERTSERLMVTSDDRWLSCLPLAHIGGLSVVLRALLTNTPLTVLPTFDAQHVTDAAQQGATLVSLVTAAMRRIDPALFRLILLGGAAPPADKPANAIATYGMTETGSGIVYDTTPLRDVHVRIDTNGEIMVQSPTLFRCYRDGTDPKRDGWFATGDAGEIIDGILHVRGRMSEVIISGGEKVWPQAVEAALRTHPLVEDVRVVGEPDPDWGHIVVAELQLSAHEVPRLDELRDHVKESLPAYAAPKRLHVVQQIARTANGKILRH